MSIRSITLVVIAVALVMLGFSLWAAPRLPAQVPSHWNAAGQVDGYSSPSFAMYLLPALTLGFGFRFSEDAPLKALLVRVNA